jgi:uncharacterized protein YkwD
MLNKLLLALLVTLMYLLTGNQAVQLDDGQEDPVTSVVEPDDDEVVIALIDEDEPQFEFTETTATDDDEEDVLEVHMLAQTTVSDQQHDLEIWDIQNQMRERPTSFIPELERMLERFSGNIYDHPAGYRLRTKEGPSAVRELISYLRRIRPVPALGWSKKLTRAAKHHVDDQGPRGRTGHTSSNGWSMGRRID